MNQGPGMLQRHQLLAEYEAVSSSGEIQKLPVFDDVIGAAQVTLVLLMVSVSFSRIYIQ